MAKGSSGGASYLKGMEVVMSNLNTQLTGIKVRSMKGLVMAAAHIRNETEQTPPLTPVDLGNLRASWFVVTPTSVAVGKGIGQFKGPNAAKLSTEHTSNVMEAQGMTASQSNATKQFITMGYGVEYSGFVHEMVGANFKRSSAGPKWLESAIKNNIGKIVQIVKENSQIKG